MIVMIMSNVWKIVYMASDEIAFLSKHLISIFEMYNYLLYYIFKDDINSKIQIKLDNLLINKL